MTETTTKTREGVMGVLKVDKKIFLLPLPPEDEGKKERVLRVGEVAEKLPFKELIPGEMLGFISGGIKANGVKITDDNRQSIHLENFLREAKKEFDLELTETQLGELFLQLGQVEQLRGKDEKAVNFMVWMFTNILLLPGQIDQLEKTVEKQTKGKHKIEVVSPTELERYLTDNETRIRPSVFKALEHQLKMHKIRATT